jgi:membrane-associated phospholipid phosphatase
VNDRQAEADVRFGARTLLIAGGLLLVAVPFGLLLLLVKTSWTPLVDVDDGARDALHTYAVAHAWFVDVLKALSTVGSALVYWPLFTGLVLWLALRERRTRLAVFVAVTVFGSWVLNALVKALVDRARPVLDDPVARAGGFSFPSGHAQSAMVSSAVLLLVFLPRLSRRAGVVAIAAAIVYVLAIGFARVGLGVHFVSDVVAGYVLGAAWVALMAAAFGAWRRDLRSEPTARAVGDRSRRP